MPIANENDAITHAEIAFGDNDTLAATYAAQIGASALFGKHIYLILLSDVYGVYRDKGDESTVIQTIDDIDEYQHLAGGSDSDNARGGMVTKFAAARIATKAGIPMRIVHGRARYPIQQALYSGSGTEFVPAVL